MKLPGCLYVLPAGVSSENGTALSGSLLSRAGVDDHVEVGERGHAGDDALHLLVGGFAAEVPARLDERLDPHAVGRAARVVEVRLRASAWYASAPSRIFTVAVSSRSV